MCGSLEKSMLNTAPVSRPGLSSSTKYRPRLGCRSLRLPEISTRLKRLGMPLAELLKIGDPYQVWEIIRRTVARVIEDPKTSEECENLVGSLGPQYEEDPEAINSLLLKVKPAEALNAILDMNPDFSLDLEPREIVQSVVEAMNSLRPGKTPPHP